MTATELTQNIFTTLTDCTRQDLQQMRYFHSHVWFWKAIVQRNLLRFLQLAVEPTLVSTAENLLYAYTYSGTMEGIVRLCQGLFGLGSVVIIDDSTPAVIDVEIQNANINFLYSLSQKDYALAPEAQFAAATSDLAAAVSYDPLQFFRNFLTPGRVLRRVHITTIEDRDAH